MNNRVPNLITTLLLMIFISPVFADNENGIRIGVSMMQITDDTGPFTLTFGTNPTGVVNRGRVDKDVSGAALEVRYPIASGWHVDVVFAPNASSTERERWPLQLIPEPSPPVQASTAFNVKTEIRGILVGTSYIFEFAQDFVGEARIGALQTRKVVSFFPPIPPGGTLQDRYSDTEIKPWFGASVSYRFFRDLSLSAEYGGTSSGLRSARIGLNWHF